MPQKLDETYEPRLWRCGECRRVLGVVMRDTNRIRRLWVFSVDRDESALPPTADLRRAPRGMFKVHGVDSCDGVECSKCGALTEWSISKESLDKLVDGMRKKLPLIEKETAPGTVASPVVDGVQ